MNRRNFLIAAAALALPLVAAANPFRPFDPTFDEPAPELLPTDLSDITGPPASARALGVHPMDLRGASAAARQLASVQIKYTEHQVIHPAGPAHQFHKPVPGGRCDECAIKDHVRRIVSMRSFFMRCPAPDGVLHEEYRRATVATFSRLVDAGVLDYGCLLPPSYMFLSTGMMTREVACLFFVYPSVAWLDSLPYPGLAEVDCFLNYAAGGQCFHLPTEMPTQSNWNGLRLVSQ